MILRWILVAAYLAFPTIVRATPISDVEIFARVHMIQPRVVAWRRDIHAHPELGNRENRTAAVVASHLRSLGLEVRTGVATTGVIGILRGSRPGRTVALRADMDALPVEEKTGLSFASHAKALDAGRLVPVMHACGHDAHVAILLGAAEILSSFRDRIAGTIVFIFEPAEEGAPLGELGGAPEVIRAGIIDAYKVDGIFGLHVAPGAVGSLFWRPGPMLAASDAFSVVLTGRQTHGAQPWNGIDISAMAADTVMAFNHIAAREINVTQSPTILSVTAINGGSRSNIIPETMELKGTLRSFAPELRQQVMARMVTVVDAVAARYGGTGRIAWDPGVPVTSNDRGLSAEMEPVLARAAEGAIRDDIDYITGAEDFAFYQAKIPGLFVDLGIGTPAGGNHSPLFDIDERAMETGVRAHILFALHFLDSSQRR